MKLQAKRVAKSILDFERLAEESGDKVINIYSFLSSQLMEDTYQPEEHAPEHEPGTEKKGWMMLESENFVYKSLICFRSKPIIRKDAEYDTSRDPLSDPVMETVRKYFCEKGFSVVYHRARKAEPQNLSEPPDEDLAFLLNIVERYALKD